jgi:hypothetical protein
MKSLGALLAVVLAAATIWATTSGEEPCKGATRPPKKAFLSDPDVFPIAAWLQDPARGPRYQKIGINLYVGLWNGPTEKQLAELKKHGMKVICAQNAVGIAHRDDPTSRAARARAMARPFFRPKSSRITGESRRPIRRDPCC